MFVSFHMGYIHPFLWICVSHIQYIEQLREKKNMFSSFWWILSLLADNVLLCCCVCVCMLTSCPGVWPRHSVWSPRGDRGAWQASWRPHSRLGSHWPECRCCRAPKWSRLPKSHSSESDRTSVRLASLEEGDIQTNRHTQTHRNKQGAQVNE